MKKIFSFLALGLLLAVSCEKQGPTTVNEITDLYSAPADAKVMTFTGGESTWSTDRRYFDLKFSDITTTLVGYDALLASGLYMVGGDEIGKAIAAKTKVNGQTPSDGWFTVNNRNGQYQITAHFGDDVYYWTGTLPFTPDPDPLKLTEVMSAQSNVANGTKSVTMNLSTGGFEQSYNENWQQVWTGKGQYLALDLYSDDGYLHDGTYTACAEGGVINPGEFGRGWDPGDLYGIGWVFTDWGTCLWTVDNAAPTAEKITDGIVKVSSREEKVDGEDVTIWTISWGVEHPVDILFEGAIPALTKPKKPDGPVSSYDYTYTIGEPSACILSDNTTVVEGVKKYPLTFVDADGQEVAYLEFVLADGATDVEPGDYVSTEYAHEVGQLANGYFFDMGDWGTFGGGSYYISDGKKVYIDPGVTVTVTQVGTGAFKFTSDGFDITASGPNFVPGGEGGGGETGPVYDMTDTVAVDCTDAANTLYEDVESHTLVLKDGETFVAQIKLVRTTGTTDLSGNYTVGEYAHEDFIAANGFDLGAMFGMDPGAWVIGSYYVKDGSIVIIEPGETITVTSAGDKTWKFVGSTGYSFTGKLQ